MAKAPKDPGPSEADRAQVEVSEATWTDYVERYRPAEAQLVKRAQYSAGERSRVRGEVSGDAAAAFKGLARKTVSASGQAGQKVGSGSLVAALAGNAGAQGEVTGVGKAAADLGGRLKSEGDKLGVTAIGRNVVAGVQTNLSQAAQRQTQVALQKSMLKAALQNQKIELGAAVLGAGVRKGKGLYDKAQTAQQDQLISTGQTVAGAPNTSAAATSQWMQDEYAANYGPFSSWNPNPLGGT